jgi:hypothetical protein
MIPSDKPDEAILAFVRELAKRAAREDHAAEIAARITPTTENSR